MIKEDSWYTRVTWSEADSREFFAKLSKCGSDFNKAECLRIQANYIADKYPMDAKKLLAILMTEYPQAKEMAHSFLLMAEIECLQENDNKALAYFRKSIECQRDVPNSQNDGHLKYAFFIASRGKYEFYDDVLETLSEFHHLDVYPFDNYISFGCRALLLMEKGKLEEARESAQKALDYTTPDESPMSYGRLLNMVNDDNWFSQRLEEIGRS